MKFVVAMVLMFCLQNLSYASDKANQDRLVECLKPLDDATLDNAIVAVSRLEVFASTQTGSDRLLTVKVAELVKRLFRAEHELTFAVSDVGPAAERARAKAQTADTWLRPNSLGHTSPTNYQSVLKQAQQIRDAADERVRSARTILGYAMRDILVELDKLNASGLPEVYQSLKSALDVVAERALKIPDSKQMTTAELGNVLVAAGIIALAVGAMSSNSSSSSGVVDEAAKARADRERAWWDKERRDQMLYQGRYKGLKP